MPKNHSKNYHDYVFRNGQLVGKFDEMYKYSEKIPWLQDKDKDKIEQKITLDILADDQPFDTIIDIGCGLGYFLNQLKKKATRRGQLFGYDISKTAVKKAGKLFPSFKFKELNFSENPNTFVKKWDQKTSGKTLYAIRGVVWYVFHKMNNIVTNLNYAIKKDQYLLISQNFPPKRTNFIGKEIIPNPQKLLSFFTKSFKPVFINYLQDPKSKNLDNWFTVLLVKK